MTVKEFLDKQLDWTIVTINEDINFGENVCAGNTEAGLRCLDVSRERIYSKYGNREIEHFYHDYDCNTNRIVTHIRITQQNN
jgi:hypothetical protein